MKNELEISRVNLYLAGKDQVMEDIFVYPYLGKVIRERENYTGEFREYIVNDRVYIDIDGQKYNKAKIIFDSVNKDKLPSTRYTVINKDGNIVDNRITNLETANLRSKTEYARIYNENIDILFESTDTTIGIELLLERLASKEYIVIRNTEYKHE